MGGKELMRCGSSQFGKAASAVLGTLTVFLLASTTSAQPGITIPSSSLPAVSVTSERKFNETSLNPVSTPAGAFASPTGSATTPNSLSHASETAPLELPSAPAVTTGLLQGNAACRSPPDKGKKADEEITFRSYWDHGLYFTVPDKQFLIHFGGTLQYDSAWFTAQPSLTRFPGGTGMFEDGTTPRRIRFRADGTVYDDLEFFIEIEFINGFTAGSRAGMVTRDVDVPTIPSLTDGYLIHKNLPFLGNVKIGNQKEPFSLEHLDSDRFLPFMEHSFLFDLTYVSEFNNGYSPGISVFRTWADDRLFTHAGLFKNLPDPFGFGLGDGEYAVTGRVGLLPLWQEAGEVYWYFGGAMSHRDPVDNLVTARIRNLIRNAPGPLLNVIATTGAIPANRNILFNLDTAYARGPLTIIGEMQSNQLHNATTANNVPQGTINYTGFYISTLYFLTGEHRSWNRRTYTFNRVIPNHHFRLDKNSPWHLAGLGAWELGARYSYLDLNDTLIRGGRLQAVTLGLNWYLNPITKMQFNYDWTYVDQAANPLAKGIVHSFGTRINFEF
jgi:phosphate-selective porin OprO/OprP